jgi:hypothetical protein
MSWQNPCTYTHEQVAALEKQITELRAQHDEDVALLREIWEVVDLLEFQDIWNRLKVRLEKE